jgi:outer membrane protein OmpA-like peptidoglycan-associated protein
VKLDKPLIEGKKYCVSFKASLSDMSKYGANNLGAYIGAQKLKEKTIMGYEIKPQVSHSRNQIMQDQYMFETICSVVTAQGGERYMVIGNFASPVEMKKKSNTVRLKRPSGFTGMQTQDAYYYIDDVKVINMEELTTCDCEPKDRNEMQVVHNENISETMDMSAADLAATKKVFFDERSKEVASGAQLAELIELMKENPTLSVEIQGHTDKQEENDYLGNLSEERAKAVYDYMIEQGIEASRLSYTGMKDGSPADESGTRDSLAKNRRVSFKGK